MLVNLHVKASAALHLLQSEPLTATGKAGSFPAPVLIAPSTSREYASLALHNEMVIYIPSTSVISTMRTFTEDRWLFVQPFVGARGEYCGSRS